MLEIRNLNVPNITMAGSRLTCATCGKPAMHEPGMKQIRFGLSEESLNDVCLCSSCADLLKGLLAIIS